MPRYFFDVHDDINIIDDEGVELPDLAAARAQAALALAETARDALPGDGSQHHFSIVVRDESGMVVLQARLSFDSEPKF